MSFVGTKDYHGTDPASQLPIVQEPKTIAQAVKAMHDHSAHMAQIMERLENLAQLQQAVPEMRTVVINPANNGAYTTLDQGHWMAKSIGVVNPTSVTVYLGVGGGSASATGHAISAGPQSMIVLPVEAKDLELGCDAAALGANTAVVYLFRFQTVQPLDVTLLGP